MMGLFNVRVRVFDLKDETRAREVEMLVDTGSNTPVIPNDIVRELGLAALETRTFILADGTEIPRRVGQAGLMTAGRRTACE